MHSLSWMKLWSLCSSMLLLLEELSWLPGYSAPLSNISEQFFWLDFLFVVWFELLLFFLISLWGERLISLWGERNFWEELCYHVLKAIGKFCRKEGVDGSEAVVQFFLADKKISVFCFCVSESTLKYRIFYLISGNALLFLMATP